MSSSISLPECEICYEAYNHSLRRPMVGSCGHSFCLQCISQCPTTKCSTCRKSKAFEEPSPNFSLLTMIPRTKEDDEAPESSTPSSSYIHIVPPSDTASAPSAPSAEEPPRRRPNPRVRPGAPLRRPREFTSNIPLVPPPQISWSDGVPVISVRRQENSSNPLISFSSMGASSPSRPYYYTPLSSPFTWSAVLPSTAV